MTESSHNQIRQILMNELGLSRESIKKEAEDIIRETVEKYLNNLKDTNGLKILVYDTVRKILFPTTWRGEIPGAEEARNVFRTVMMEWFKENIKISIERNINPSEERR